MATQTLEVETVSYELDVVERFSSRRDGEHRVVDTTRESGSTLPPATLKKGRSIIVIAQLAGINFVTSFCGGILTIGLPTIAEELALEPALLLWPSSAFYLATGATLLIAGALADAIGAKTINLAGCFFLTIFFAANSVAQTGLQLIIFRAMQGLASSLVVPSAIAIISTSIESGRRRNIGFATLGLSMVLGFSFGLVLGGLLVSGPGWRIGYYIAAASSAAIFVMGLWALPKGVKSESETSMRQKLTKEIDWVGAGIASTSLALFSYVLA